MWLRHGTAELSSTLLPTNYGHGSSPLSPASPEGPGGGTAFKALCKPQHQVPLFLPPSSRQRRTSHDHRSLENRQLAGQRGHSRRAVREPGTARVTVPSSRDAGRPSLSPPWGCSACQRPGTGGRASSCGHPQPAAAAADAVQPRPGSRQASSQQKWVIDAISGQFIPINAALGTSVFTTALLCSRGLENVIIQRNP